MNRGLISCAHLIYYSTLNNQSFKPAAKGLAARRLVGPYASTTRKTNCCYTIMHIGTEILASVTSTLIIRHSGLMLALSSLMLNNMKMSA